MEKSSFVDTFWCHRRSFFDYSDRAEVVENHDGIKYRCALCYATTRMEEFHNRPTRNGVIVGLAGVILFLVGFFWLVHIILA